MTLWLRGHVALPSHLAGGFDHGDVHAASARVFVAHTANGTVDVVDGEHLQLIESIPGCPEGSGVLCTHGDDALVFAAARGAGQLLVIDPLTFRVRNEIAVGPKPNGIAWDAGRQHVLVADVEDYRARLVEPLSGAEIASTVLPRRPRWCVFDGPRDRFLVNIREPACVAALDGATAALLSLITVSAAGPHGLDIDPSAERAFVACDAGELAVLDLRTDREVARVPIGGEPDAIWFNAQRGLLYVAIGDPGLIDVVDCGSMSMAERIDSEHGAHTTAFDTDRQRLYVFLPGSCRAAVYDEAPAA